MMDSPPCPYSVSCFMMCCFCCCKGHGTEEFRAVVSESLVWMGCTSCNASELLWPSHWGVGDESSQRHLLKGCQGEPGAFHSIRQPHPSFLNNLYLLFCSDTTFPKLPIFFLQCMYYWEVPAVLHALQNTCPKSENSIKWTLRGAEPFPHCTHDTKYLLCLFSLNTQG